jgi:hypothetical protein
MRCGICVRGNDNLLQKFPVMRYTPNKAGSGKGRVPVDSEVKLDILLRILDRNSRLINERENQYSP